MRQLTLGRGPGPDTPVLVFSRYEVTESEFGQVEAPSNIRDLPAVGMTRSEAEQWCAARGMRLPTVEEWRWLASSGATAVYPWHSKWDGWRANTLELGLHRPLPVGTFESGRSALGAYDFGGNVWEWTSSAAIDVNGESLGEAAACGGSFASDIAAAQVSSVRGMHADDRAEDVGFRPIAEAPAYLRDHVQQLWLKASEADREGLQAAMSEWPADLRNELADDLAELGVDAGLCEALREPVAQ